ncbi:MAG TPA: ATP-binding protein [Ktedonobacteraceae bacterium]|nr:ATP-binding protein [Ktedonobacteraceae bacterium]
MTQDTRTTNALFFDPSEGPRGHFLLHLYAIIAHILTHIESGETDRNHLDQFPFLLAYQAMLGELVPDEVTGLEQNAWWEKQIVNWEADALGQRSQALMPLHLPLLALREEGGLTLSETLLLIAVGLVEEDIRFGALFATLQAPLNARRPSLGMLGWLMGGSDHTPDNAWDACHTLLDCGLLQVENPSDPRAEWVLRIPASIWDALRGEPDTKPAPGLTLQLASDFPLLDDLILPAAIHERILHLPRLLQSAQANTLLLRGMSGSGRRTTLGALARSLNRHVLLWEGGKPGDDSWRLLGPLATLVRAVPILRLDPAPGETLDLPMLTGYNGPVGITLGRVGGLRGPLLARSLGLSIPPPDASARRRFWQAAQLPIQPSALDKIVPRFLLTGGHIHRAATLAHTYALLANRSDIAPGDVQQATRLLNRQALETLATALEPANGWSDLVVNTSIADELSVLETRCRNRESLREQVGPALKQSLNRGVRALFSGPSGTGKTLAARVLAAVLQMDLYRVDLAAVVNKYIGETERNLNQVFSRAEELDVILLLDEGDALMTNRTDVRTANDRYANLETNYLLQRLETYEGIVIITTNAGSRIDSAFLRRIDAIIEFAQPEAPERWQIWQSHLPSPHSASQTFLQEVAVRCVLTGGQIRNAALHATLLAVDNAGQMSDLHIEKAVRREYRKAGAACPLRAIGS